MQQGAFAYSMPAVLPVQQGGSYVPPPTGTPPKLTEGLPDPTSVERQKAAYAKSIEANLRNETGQLKQRNQEQKKQLQKAIESQNAQYSLQLDQYLQQAAMAIDQQANAEMMMLQEAAMQQKMALEQQATSLSLEFQQKKAQEEMLAREYQIQKRYHEEEVKLHATYQKQHGLNSRPQPQEGGPPGGAPGGTMAGGPYVPPVVHQAGPGLQPSMTHLQPSMTHVMPPNPHESHYRIL
jgi:hypothetical protein